MILTLFGFLVLLSLVFIVIGIFKEDETLQAIIGFTFLFLLSFQLIDGTLEYKTGFNESSYYVYGDNFTGYHWDYDNDMPPNTEGEIFLFHKDTSNIYIYENYQNKTIGFYLALLSAFGFSFMLYGMKKIKRPN